MYVINHYKRCVALLALIAMLINGFAPAIAHAIATPKTTPWMQICSVSGIQYVPLTLNLSSANKDNPATGAFTQTLGDDLQNVSTGPASDLNHKMPMQHCAYCMSHAQYAALPFNHDLTVFDRHINREFPPLFYQSHAPLFAWVVANPRAPPPFSFI